MRKRLGRHSAYYGDLQPRASIATTDQARIVPLDNRLRNIANANFEKDRLRIECWPSTNSAGRKWGSFKNDQALVLCFKIRAQHEKTITVNEFELSLVFGSEDILSETESDDVEIECASTDNSSVGLVDVPSPDFVEGRCQRTTTRSDQDTWHFQAQSLGNPARGAKWTWETKTYDTPMLHAGLALIHPGQPFFALCRVKVKASRLRKRFKFESSRQNLQILRLDPEDSDECLEDMITGLNEEIKARNLGKAVEKAVTAAVRSQYGSSMIEGHAQVHFGDNIYPSFSRAPQ